MPPLLVWTEVLSAIGGVATPIFVLILGIFVATQRSRNDELLRARMEDYRRLVPDLNTLMCYVTFIGTWRDQSPPDIVALKRRLDRAFFCAAPLFTADVSNAYSRFMNSCFSTFGEWGADARIKSGPFRRQSTWCRPEFPWNPDWNAMFTKRATESIPASELRSVRQNYDQLIVCLVADLKISRTTSSYTTTLVSLNAHAPEAKDIDGPSVSGKTR